MDTDLLGAFSVGAFCAVYGIGRTKFYDEVRNGRLTPVKLGRKTLVPRGEARRWQASLPAATSTAAHR